MSNSTSMSCSSATLPPITITATLGRSNHVSTSIAAAVSSSVLGADSTTTVYPSTTNVVTSIVSASALPPTTNIITSVVTASAVTNGITDTNPVTIVITSINSPTTTAIVTGTPGTSRGSTATTTTSMPAALSPSAASSSNNNTTTSSGLGTAGKTAIAVVIPVAFVAILVAFGIWFWRRRKQRKEDSEQRRKEIDDYGYNPNHDPSLPAVAASESGQPQMTEDANSGYRGWGAAAAGGVASHRKASTTLSGGHTQGQLSDSGHSYGHSPNSPNGGVSYSDGHSGDPLVHTQRDTMNSDELGALGAAPLSSANAGIRRGPSNASSAYSAGAKSEGSDEPMSAFPGSAGGGGAAQEYGQGGGYGYGQHGPYGDGSYGGAQEAATAMPIVRDVSARRNTRIQQAGVYGQGNSGIAQNF
ncbi:hypothetical protein BAUCODRAFT_138843 [Baudoinia panamericana UAMH 10762]|uniref:Uncharacterized protein n=1 Tax=Baudoinia panamericana (strain UAMH 10762) TaxID=717646 RepID=M2N0X2_BAUPA|nr:uncharacterized protein BAUCODRAFT_138843 [Baudoinia panamericana UAMH 10762]EMC97573.1 hypothetical protein BAUCODRAFT_138843 [Baudoinia panamericana UAMH 10762]